jgi:RNA polymerase sigma-70 factor (ECF subfamily)
MHQHPTRGSRSSPVEQIAARDRLWVERIRTGDAPAFEAMFRAYKNDLGAFLQRFLRSREAAEEVIQDLFLRIWEQRHEWEVAVPLNIYLFRAARNRAISYLRHQRVETRFRERVSGAADGGVRPPSPSWADERARVSELEDAIERAVNELPERCREVFRLNRYHHLSYVEVAEVMGISVKTVEVQMGRALTALREQLASWRG